MNDVWRRYWRLPTFIVLSWGSILLSTRLVELPFEHYFIGFVVGSGVVILITLLLPVASLFIRFEEGKDV